MHTRLKELRKGHLKLTQKEFADRIGINRSHLACMENGSRVVVPRTVISICREFNVNEEWLVNGEGDVFIDEVANLKVKEEIKQLAKMYLSLSETQRLAFTNMMKEASNIEKVED